MAKRSPALVVAAGVGLALGARRGDLLVVAAGAGLVLGKRRLARARERVADESRELRDALVLAAQLRAFRAAAHSLDPEVVATAVASAVTTGVVGNAAYDAVKALVTRMLRRDAPDQESETPAEWEKRLDRAAAALEALEDDAVEAALREFRPSSPPT